MKEHTLWMGDERGNTHGCARGSSVECIDPDVNVERNEASTNDEGARAKFPHSTLPRCVRAIERPRHSGNCSEPMGGPEALTKCRPESASYFSRVVEVYPRFLLKFGVVVSDHSLFAR